MLQQVRPAALRALSPLAAARDNLNLARCLIRLLRR